MPGSNITPSLVWTLKTEVKMCISGSKGGATFANLLIRNPAQFVVRGVAQRVHHIVPVLVGLAGELALAGAGSHGLPQIPLHALDDARAILGDVKVVAVQVLVRLLIGVEMQPGMIGAE